MLNTLFENIRSKDNLRSELLSLKKELKALQDSSVPSYIVEGRSVFTELLKHEDPKVRQNAVQILGLIGAPDTAEAIYEAYLSDETFYNRSSYIEALSTAGYKTLKEKLLARRNELIEAGCTLENKKHYIDELHALSTLLQPEFKEHEFTGSRLVNEFVLLTNRNFKSVTMKQLEGIPHKEFTAGVMVKTKNLDQVKNSIRTYSELLFIPDGIRLCSSDPVVAAKELAESGITDFIFSRLSDPDIPVFFRADYRAKDKRTVADFEKKISSELEYNSKFRLVNSTTDYELEFRFIDTSDSKLVVLIRFCSLKDERFSYKTEALPVSIKASTAALLMKLAEEHFTDDATVLDPFCGCGTMLVEREHIRPVRMFYGIDIFGDAIEAARKNLAAAKLLTKTELIKRDFFDFTHKYKFNEVITDMPFVTGKKDLKEIESLYSRFFKKIPVLLEDDARLFIYSRNRDLLRKYSLSGGFKIVSEFEISKMEGSYFYILTR